MNATFTEQAGINRVDVIPVEHERFNEWQFDRNRPLIKKAVIFTLLVYIAFWFLEYTLIDEPNPLSLLRALGLPFFPLTYWLLSNKRVSARLFFCINTLGFISAALVFATFAFSYTHISLFHCSTALSITVALILSIHHTPPIYGLVAGGVICGYYFVLCAQLSVIDMAIHAGLPLSVLLILLIGSIIRQKQDKALYESTKDLNKKLGEQQSWSFTTSRLLRHELSNQLIALSSSLEMYEIAGKDEKISQAEDPAARTWELQNLVTELALTSEATISNDESFDLVRLISDISEAQGFETLNKNISYPLSEQTYAVVSTGIRLIVQAQSEVHTKLNLETDDSKLILKFTADTKIEGEETAQPPSDGAVKFRRMLGLDILKSQRLNIAILETKHSADLTLVLTSDNTV